MKIEPQMDRLHAGNNHKSFIVREAVGGDKRRQSRRSIGSAGRDCKKATTSGWETSAALGWTHNIYATALIAVKFISLF